MSEAIKSSDAAKYDPEMVKILDMLFEQNRPITARSVAKHHPSIKCASSITRNPRRSELLAKYQELQRTRQDWFGKLMKSEKRKAASALAERDVEIAELNHKVSTLIASHIAMIRAVGEMGGMSQWAKFYQEYKAVRVSLEKLSVEEKV